MMKGMGIMDADVLTVSNNFQLVKRLEEVENNHPPKLAMQSSNK